MILTITSTTDSQHVGTVIDTDVLPIPLGDGDAFEPERVWQIAPGTWRLAGSGYIIDAQE